MPRRRLAGLLAALVALTSAAAAQDAEPAESRPAYNILTAKHLTGDWGGFRTDLADAGVVLRLTYQQQYMVNMSGGLETTNGSDFAGSYDLNLLLDLHKLLKIPGAQFFMRGKGTYGGEASDFDREKIGGLFRTNADASVEESIFVDKWWWRQRLLDDRVSFRLGRLSTVGDLIDPSDYAGSADTMFLNQGLDRNPIIPHKNGLGASVKIWPTDWLYTTFVVLDHDSRPRTPGFDDAFCDRAYFRALWEWGVKPNYVAGLKCYPGSYRIGTWFVPGERPVYFNSWGGLRAPKTSWSDTGFYLGIDQLVYRERETPGDMQGLGLFCRYGYAHGQVNFLEHFWSAGASYKGLLPTRDKDTLAFGVAQGIVSGDYRRQIDGTADRETAYELYYAIQATPWLVVTPDMQFINQPGGNQDSRDAWVFGIRLRVNF